MITVVDAAHFWDTYGDPVAEGKIGGESHAHSLAHLLAGQIEFADIILLNKTDLDALRRRIFAGWPDVATGVVRSKGTLNVAGSDDVLLWNQAGRRVSLEVIGRWKEGGARGAQLVLIGRDLDPEPVSAALEACTLPADAPASGPPPIAGGRQELVLGRS